MYLYPTSFIPEETITSATSFTNCSSIFIWKVFQLFHPIGGVRASPSNFCAKALQLIKSKSKSHIFFTINFFLEFLMMFSITHILFLPDNFLLAFLEQLCVWALIKIEDLRFALRYPNYVEHSFVMHGWNLCFTVIVVYCFFILIVA